MSPQSPVKVAPLLSATQIAVYMTTKMGFEYKLQLALSHTVQIVQIQGKYKQYIHIKGLQLCCHVPHADNTH